MTDIVDLEFFEKLAPRCFRSGMTCVVEFEPHSLWHEVLLAIAKQALGRRVKTEYHVFQHTPTEIGAAIERNSTWAAMADSNGREGTRS